MGSDPGEQSECVRARARPQALVSNPGEFWATAAEEVWCRAVQMRAGGSIQAYAHGGDSDGGHRDDCVGEK